jgi:hypothetical protein
MQHVNRFVWTYWNSIGTPRHNLAVGYDWSIGKWVVADTLAASVEQFASYAEARDAYLDRVRQLIDVVSY